ncbi:hypothetical protein CYMTET_5405 [Cymbomonas tetramitiformis]|uniref:Uncharacterized protein n=1 Tax=Cymbomonas tetramitiformis TaxID=36881 RepID=A0AAE0GZE0_9CHLO|nr:hypothetical protein CYMTET_5405 [Cymbomonas tetramitiformis]
MCLSAPPVRLAALASCLDVTCEFLTIRVNCIHVLPQRKKFQWMTRVLGASSSPGDLTNLGLREWRKEEAGHDNENHAREERIVDTTTHARLGVAGRVATWMGLLATLFTAVTTQAFPLLRLFAVAYILWSATEFYYHRNAMHAPAKSVFRKYFNHHCKLHFIHHIDTASDMSLRDGFDEHAVYFHYRVTAYASVISAVLLSAINYVFNMGAPMWGAALVSVGLALTHGTMWNTMHAGCHNLSIDIRGGLPALKEYPRNNFFVKWVERNHTAHHVMRGHLCNYNIVFPLFDHLYGTYFYKLPVVVKQEVVSESVAA